jgi:hypothetical protein
LNVVRSPAPACESAAGWAVARPITARLTIKAFHGSASRFIRKEWFLAVGLAASAIFLLFGNALFAMWGGPVGMACASGCLDRQN